MKSTASRQVLVAGASALQGFKKGEEILGTTELLQGPYSMSSSEPFDLLCFAWLLVCHSQLYHRYFVIVSVSARQRRFSEPPTEKVWEWWHSSGEGSANLSRRACQIDGSPHGRFHERASWTLSKVSPTQLLVLEIHYFFNRFSSSSFKEKCCGQISAVLLAHSSPFVPCFALIVGYREQHPTFADAVCSSLISLVVVVVGP